MPRLERETSQLGIYHIVLRSINRQTIFFDDEDGYIFLDKVKTTKEKFPYELFAYCFMRDHIHLLIKEVDAPISKIIQNILATYVFWYNKKYERQGNLFQSRFKSEAIEETKDILFCSRYIHQHPVRPGAKLDEYKWSSYHSYINEIRDVVNKDYLLTVFDSKEKFIDFMNQREQKTFIEFYSKVPLSDKRLKELAIEICTHYNVEMQSLHTLPDETLKELLATVKTIPGSSLRQIAKVLGVPIWSVRIAGKK
ncbi:MAG: transposase [Firmicutes bacterium]|nr:transposase [Bacillota bacterium]MCL2256306.1 transposase [Bacillota bacterium]